MKTIILLLPIILLVSGCQTRPESSKENNKIENKIPSNTSLTVVDIDVNTGFPITAELGHLDKKWFLENCYSKEQIDTFLTKIKENDDHNSAIILIASCWFILPPPDTLGEIVEIFRDHQEIGDNPFIDYYMGLFYLAGYSIPSSLWLKHLELALAFFEHSKENGCHAANFAYFDTLFFGNWPEHETDDWFTSYPKKDDANYLLRMGIAELHGRGVKKDVDSAKKKFEIASKHGSFLANVFLGVFYFQEEQFDKAAEYLKIGIPENIGVGHIIYGDILAREGDIKRAKLEYYKAARRFHIGDPEQTGVERLAGIFEREENFNEAYKLYVLSFAMRQLIVRETGALIYSQKLEETRAILNSRFKHILESDRDDFIKPTYLMFSNCYYYNEELEKEMIEEIRNGAK